MPLMTDITNGLAELLDNKRGSDGGSGVLPMGEVPTNVGFGFEVEIGLEDAVAKEDEEEGGGVYRLSCFNMAWRRSEPRFITLSQKGHDIFSFCLSLLETPLPVVMRLYAI